MRRRSIRSLTAVLVLVVTLLLVAAIATGAVADAHLNDARTQLASHIDPELTQTTQLTGALVNQETGTRGYLLTGRADFLQPYRLGLAQQRQAIDRLRALGATSDTLAGADLDRVVARATAWQQQAAAHILANRGDVTLAQVVQDKVLFDQLRTTLARMTDNLEQARDQASDRLAGAASATDWVLGSIAGLLVVLFVLFYAAFRRLFVVPIVRLADEVRTVANDDIHSVITGSGPRELVDLAADTETMRRRIVDEVTELRQAREVIGAHSQELEAANANLARSNADLEQFAYVASHDLQEPLRKVASFCQLLQRRYQDELDERANQYIDFAVDGAKRMQILINGLLAFSRVGRRHEQATVIDAQDVFDRAMANLATLVIDTGATVTHTALPPVRAAATLLTVVFQNLIDNAIKFRGAQPPMVHVSSERDGDDWACTVTDNGIGIDGHYAERIFVIFQRLHTKDKYPGTGIGLAMCRRIVQFHGGSIWLDTTYPGPGARFRFTLPALPAEPSCDPLPVTEGAPARIG